MGRREAIRHIVGVAGKIALVTTPLAVIACARPSDEERRQFFDPTSSSSTRPPEPAKPGWKQYRSEQYPFEINYPDGWQSYSAYGGFVRDDGSSVLIKTDSFGLTPDGKGPNVNILAVPGSEKMDKELIEASRRQFVKYSGFEEKKSRVAGNEALLLKGNFNMSTSEQPHQTQKLIFTQGGDLWQITFTTPQADVARTTEVFGQMLQAMKITGAVVKKPESGGQQRQAQRQPDQAAPKAQEAGMTRSRAGFFEVDSPTSWTPTPFSNDAPSFEIEKHRNGFVSRVIGSKVQVLQGNKPRTLDELERRMSDVYSQLKWIGNPKSALGAGSSRIRLDGLKTDAFHVSLDGINDGFGNPISLNSVVFMYAGEGWEIAMLAYPDVTKRELPVFLKMAKSIRATK
ncbi:hypothetical protein HYW66_01490 [Candidatus Microgenomates bacterium]|nr:hypothetical protein [Candidatus Microgenomates bacterium]